MQITYFPYLPLKDNQHIDLGDGLVIWHFYSLAENYIPDQSKRDFIKRLLDTNVQGESQERIKGIAVASIGATDFEHLALKKNSIYGKLS